MPRAESIDRSDAEGALALDPDTLDKNLHYRFVQSRPRNIARRRAQGYEPVSWDEGVRLLYDEGESKSADGLVRVGDLILMACSKDRYKERRSRQARLTRERLGSGEDQFKTRARKRGVRSLTGNEGERK